VSGFTYLVLRGVPSRIGQVLDLPMQQLEKVIYFAAYVIINVDEDEKKKIASEIEAEFTKKKINSKKKFLKKMTKLPKKNCKIR